jgi:hypothetical protein
MLNTLDLRKRIANRFEHGVHGPEDPWIDFKDSVNLVGKKLQLYTILQIYTIFSKPLLKYGFSSNNECRKQSNLWPLESKNVC